ncbi:MAG: hypothetical protein Tsb0020_19190 [Haliangiales bacterium]
MITSSRAHRSLTPLLVLALWGACDNNDVVAYVDGLGPDAYCPTPGAPVRVDDGATELQCAGRIAERVFEHAICVCADLTTDRPLTVDGFDSSQGAYDPGAPTQLASTVAVNGDVQANDTVQISGDLIAAGATGVSPGPNLTIAGALASNGALEGADSRVEIGGDASVGGDITLSEFTVNGVLTTPPEATVTVSGAEQINQRATAAVAIAPPCPCAAEDRIDIAAIIAAQAQDNDNQSIELDPSSLANFATDTTLELPCGRFYLDRVQSDQAALTLRVTGRAGLYVSAGITLGRSLTVELAPQASLDLFVTDFVNVAGDLYLGDPDAPDRLRIYVDRAGAVNLSGRSVLAGNLYAPESTLSLPAGAEIFGAVFVDRIAASDTVSVHHDVAIQSAAAICP